MSARGIAHTALAEIERGGEWTAAALDRALAMDPTLLPADRALATELVYGVLRHQARLDHALAACIHDGARGLSKAHPGVRRALRVAAYQILMLDRVPASAAVDAAVTAIKRDRDPRTAGFANAVLRRLAREGEPPRPDPGTDPKGFLVQWASLPPWLARRLRGWFGDATAVRLAEALLERPPQTVRANPHQGSREALAAALAATAGEGERRITATPTAHAPEGLQLTGLRDPASHPLHAQGAFTIQDEASQLVAHLAAPRPGEWVLDACAGRGGKTLHLAALATPPPSVLPADRQRGALRALRARAARMGLPVLTPLQADTAAPLPLSPEARFDQVLLDAPCSGLGVLRRHPEAKWRLSPNDVKDLAARQAALLDRLADRVRPGGTLVYAVCTVTPAEGPEQVAAFCERHPAFTPEPPPADGPVDWAPLLADPAPKRLPPGTAVAPRPDRHGTDGFFMVRLRRAR